MEAPSRSWSPVPRLPLRAWPGGRGMRVSVKPDRPGGTCEEQGGVAVAQGLLGFY